jgi:hypothetical protein
LKRKLHKLGSGHEEKYYQTADQRFLGDEAFVEKVALKAKNKDVRLSGPRVSFDRLLAAILKEHGLTEETLMGSGRRERLGSSEPTTGVPGS